MTWRRRTVAVLVSAISLCAASCGDGTPAFCTPLAETAKLSDLVAALDSGDLENAASEAQRLRDLASEAPPEIRADFTALADAVVDIVRLITDERDSTTSLTPGATTVPSGAAPGSTSTTVDPGELERQRNELNNRLGELDRRSDRISSWAQEQCGLELS